MPQLNSARAAEVRQAGEEQAKFGGAMPEGKYRLKLTEVESTNSQAGDPMWVWNFEITEFLDPQNIQVDTKDKAEAAKEREAYRQALVGRDMKYWTVIKDTTLWDLDRVFAAFGADPSTDTDELIGDEVVAMVVREIIGKGRRKGQLGNSISEFFTLDDGLPVQKKAEDPDF